MARYRLKAMVMVRMLAEATVCVLFFVIPIVLQLSGVLPGFPPAVRAMLLCLAGIGVLLTPWFGFITWLVTTSDSGLKTYSLFKIQTVDWDKIKNLTRRSSFAWLRYVIESDDGELSFPVLLNKVENLVAEITDHLPATAGRLRSSHRVFVYDKQAFALQMLQSLAALIFAIIFWFFFAAKMNIKHNTTDTVLLLCFCAFITLIFVWRFKVVATMPRALETTKEALVITTYFGRRAIAWKDVKNVSLPVPLLPEGFTVKTNKGSFLIGAAMEAADELQAFIKSRLNGAGGKLDATGSVDEIDFDAIKVRLDEQLIRSQELLASLREKEVDIEAACEIDHCFYADTHYAITGLGQNLADQGFEVDVFAPIESEELNIEYWTMKVRVSQPPDVAGGEKSAAFMTGLADQYSCVYDGWAPDLATT